MRNSKVFILILSLVGMMGLQGCLSDAATFEVDTIIEMVVPAGLSSDRNLIFQQQVFIPYSQSLELNNVVEGDVESVNGILGLATPKFAAISDLSFIAEIEIDVLDPFNPSQTGREIFHYVQRDFRRRSEIDLTPSIPDVKDLIMNDMVFLNIEMSFNIPPPITFTMVYDLRLGVFEIEEM